MDPKMIAALLVGAGFSSQIASLGTLPASISIAKIQALMLAAGIKATITVDQVPAVIAACSGAPPSVAPVDIASTIAVTQAVGLQQLAVQNAVVDAQAQMPVIAAIVVVPMKSGVPVAQQSYGWFNGTYPNPYGGYGYDYGPYASYGPGSYGYNGTGVGTSLTGPYYSVPYSGYSSGYGVSVPYSPFAYTGGGGAYGYGYAGPGYGMSIPYGSSPYGYQTGYNYGLPYPYGYGTPYGYGY